MNRRLVIKGAFFDVECACIASGASPAAQFLDELRKGIWDGDPTDPDRPSDEQIHDYDLLLTILKHVVTHGEPPHATAVNYLDRGVWEFKFGNKRVTFFDTRGDGTWDEKPRIRDRASGVPDSEYWWFPEFDATIRLGHCFTKLAQTTDREDIAKALKVREEDIAHDKNP